jgi:isoleucyl-tRNA synthetase
MEREVLSFWDENRVFQRTVEATAEGDPWTVYEGPPTANGTPGSHHIEARAFKDILPRFKTMRGAQVARRAGWDCHGLPVELAVEKQLEFNGKPDIEAFGIAEFNEKCRESVMRHVDEWQQLTHRMGYWVDLEDPYKTMDSAYIQSVWWSLKQIYDKGLLQEDFRVTPYCPRCGTALSDHELAQGYEEDRDLSVYVRFPLTSGPAAGASLLVWTTTPWTLIANTAVAVHPEMTYVVASNGVERVVIAEALIDKALGEGWSIGVRFSGAELAGWTYQRPFDLVAFPEDVSAHIVVTAEYVTATDGTGLVHQAPAFGADDMAVARAYGLPVVNPVSPDGCFAEDLPLVGGTFFKNADPVLTEDLHNRGLLFRKLDYVHQYPHCWRCHTHLLYYALPAWYIRTTQIKSRLLEENEKTNWYPDTIKNGRYGDWLANNVDWALSRSRYWGTPLPIWRNDVSGEVIVVGSLAELGDYAGRDLSGLDPHRPYIDEVIFRRDAEEGTYRRVPDVIDAWFDSGAMPFAQWGYPHVIGSVEKLERAYPAQYICEALDQTRGWFYSLMTVGTLTFDRSSYDNVVCLGHILAEDGRKMSKHLGNIVLPIPLMERFGADAVRWFMACAGSPWSSRLLGENAISDVVRKVLLTYWNVVSFQALYARSAGWRPDETGSQPQQRSALDRWLLGETNQLAVTVTAAMENFDTQRAGIAVSEFVDNLSNWYVRRSRRRFWSGDASALATLHEALETLTLLMAPITPFIAERVWQDLFRSTADTGPISVHLATWPDSDQALIDESLASQMRSARRVVELGRTGRKNAQVKTRQPLRRAAISSLVHETLSDDLLREVAEELNVQDVVPFSSTGDLVRYRVKGNFRELGRRHGKMTPRVAAAIAAADSGTLVASLQHNSVATVEVDGARIDVTSAEVIIAELPVDGWTVVTEDGHSVGLDLDLDEPLLLAGVARDVIREIQEGRKAANFEVTDRIELRWCARGRTAQAIHAHVKEIAEEVLAMAVTFDVNVTDVINEDLGLSFAIDRQIH